MLVVSRKADEAIVFPGLGITVNLLRLNGRTARIGIEAASHIKVMRKELLDGDDLETLDVGSFESSFNATSDELHDMRNQFNALNLGLQLYRQQMDAGLSEASRRTFQRVLERLAQIEKKISNQADRVEQNTQPESTAQRLRVLLVEDDADQREMLAGVLQMRGCDVTTVTSGDEAVAFLKSHASPDFVLLDMQMPNGDGATTVRKLRNCDETSSLKIVATSGMAPTDLGVGPGNGGVNYWFPKPLNTDGLLEYMQKNETAVLSTTA